MVLVPSHLPASLCGRIAATLCQITSICRLVPTAAEIAVFNRQVVFLASWRGASVVRDAVSVVVGGGATLLEVV